MKISRKCVAVGVPARVVKLSLSLSSGPCDVWCNYYVSLGLSALALCEIELGFAAALGSSCGIVDRHMMTRAVFLKIKAIANRSLQEPYMP